MSNYGLGGLFKPRGSGRWWIRYSVHGKQIRESSGSTSESKARALLRRRLGEVAAGKFAGPTAERTMVTQLLDGLISVYEINHPRSLASTRSVLKHVREHFADVRAVDVTLHKLREYILARRHRRAADASIHLELGHLHHAFRLGA